MVYRVFVEKKKELAQEAKSLLGEARDLLGIKNLTDVRVINRYDAENITPELFDYAKRTVFSEPQLDIVSDSIEINGKCFAVEFLPGQFDQRADSAAQCIQIISQGERPLIRTAKNIHPHRRHNRRRRAEDKEICHQPRRGARGEPRKARDSRGKIRYPDRSQNS